MGFSQEAGYTPSSVQSLMTIVMNNINTQFSLNYTPETFVGTNFYKYFYALIQELQDSEVKTSEIFLKLQDFFKTTNERISRPVASDPGILEKFEADGFVASVKPMVSEDAGKRHVCVDVEQPGKATGTITITSYANLVSGDDDVISVGGVEFTAQSGSATPGDGTFQAASSNNATASSLATQINAHPVASQLVEAEANDAEVTITAVSGGEYGNSIGLDYEDNDTNIGATLSGTSLSGGEASSEYDQIAEIISKSTVGGVVSVGPEAKRLVLSNGQSFDYRWFLPNRIDVLLRLTITLSKNNQFVIKSPEEVKEILLANIASKYRLGKNFEPQRYFTILDAPWAESILLEWSDDAGGNWYSGVYDADFDDLFEMPLENITVVEA